MCAYENIPYTVCVCLCEHHNNVLLRWGCNDDLRAENQSVVIDVEVAIISLICPFSYSLYDTLWEHKEHFFFQATRNGLRMCDLMGNFDLFSEK